MKTLLKGAKIINVLTDEIEENNILIEDKKIIGVGDYDDAEKVIDVSDKYICPSFIDGHIHIESTNLTPKEFAKVCIEHGTGAIVADPHEIANVCGTDGFDYMLNSSKGLPINVYFMLSSCVPASPFDESGATLEAKDLLTYYDNDNVLGLAEVMNYPGVINNDKALKEKIDDAKRLNKIINGHAPLLTLKDLDKYIANGIYDDHECTNLQEALEKMRKGQIIMIREGTSAKNLDSLLPLFDEPYNRRCILVSDDKHAYDLKYDGHIDHSIRKAVKQEKNVLAAIRMATIQPANHFKLNNLGAIAPGYYANLLVLNDLDNLEIEDVYFEGQLVCKNHKVLEFENQIVDDRKVRNTFHMKDLKADDFKIEAKSKKCKVIKVLPGNILTECLIKQINWEENNGVDVNEDIIKLAVIERHKGNGNMSLDFINGLKINKGAIASSIAHDSHNLIIAGTNNEDMALAGMTVKEMGGGLVVVLNGQVLAKMPLAIAGLMSDKSCDEVIRDLQIIKDALNKIACTDNIDQFMLLSFIALAVIPSLKMTTLGLVDVNKFEITSLYVE